MTTLIYLLVALLAAALAYFVLGRIIRAYLKFRGTRLVTCPETEATAAVQVNAAEAAWRGALSRTSAPFHLNECSRWPEQKDCGQECLREISESPEDCLLRSILEKWYADKSCACCGKTFGEIHWYDHKPGLMSPEGRPLSWNVFRPEEIPEILETFLPVCWDCVIAERFRLEHPELVIDRQWGPEERARLSRTYTGR